MDVTHACRCCLRCAPDKDLMTPYTHLGKTEIYADMIKECFDIHLVVGGAGACGICSACVGRLRDASDFKLQVQRSQEELQARSLRVSPVKDEEPPVKTETLDQDGASDEMLYDMLGLNIAAGDGACDEDDLLDEELLNKPESNEDETSDEMSLCSDGNAARVREQLAMDCFVVLERLNRGDETYDCERCCGKHLRNKYILRKHIRTTRLSTRLKKTTFQTESLVLKHEKSEHECTNFMCDECEYTTSSKTSLQTHLKSHSGDNVFNCSHCSYTSLFKSDLHKHQAIHTRDMPFRCNECDFKCSFESNLRLHQMIHDQIPQKTQTGGKPFLQCGYCDYKCSGKSKLQCHIRKHTGEKPYQCSFCDYKSSGKENLQRHIRIHTGEKPYKCNYCDFKTCHPSALREHKMRHTGEKPFLCSYCDYKCTNKSHLKVHLMLHTGEKPFKCSHCDFKTCHPSAFREHKMRHTGEEPFLCSYCDYKSTNKSHLQRHQRTHTGEKPFKCSHCDFKTCHPSALREHKKRHHGEAQYTNLNRKQI
ncbi:oocyte zinc finger protein XlCOF6-like [Cydia strobilella]|uniref:oocyte zinc finger protein XlCOF6-like n=1 Tax=Cydia strobilella TaxID=1100964 RepID=UPI0030059E8A